MLRDHRQKQVQRAQEAFRRRQAPQQYGEWLQSAARWSWFVTVTFRRARGRDVALGELERFLNELEVAAGEPILWVIAEAFGKIRGRYHCHLLIAGVDRVSIDPWEREAHRRFGWTEIEPYEPSLGGAHYVARNAFARNGELHFGGSGSNNNAIGPRP
ncbi:MAG TPA: hypothetical protein VKR61_13935 [Bryobacteraceae bacterium]|nr:hypothetical protein [Bryobacteraceae bacterium]